MAFPISGLIFMWICAVGAGFMLAWLVLEAKLSMENSRELSRQKAMMDAQCESYKQSLTNTYRQRIDILNLENERKIAVLKKIMQHHGIDVSISEQTLEIHNSSDDWLYS